MHESNRIREGQWGALSRSSVLLQETLKGRGFQLQHPSLLPESWHALKFVNIEQLSAFLKLSNFLAIIQFTLKIYMHLRFLKNLHRSSYARQTKRVTKRSV